MKNVQDMDKYLDLSFVEWTENDLQKQKENIVKLKEELYKKYFDIADDERSFTNTIELGDNYSIIFKKILSQISFVVNLHTDEKMRVLAQKLEVEIGNILVEMDFDYKFFLSFKYYYENIFKQTDKTGLSSNKVKMVEDIFLGYKRSGMFLSADKRKILKSKIKVLQKLNSEYSLEYNKTYSLGFWILESEILGIDKDFFSSFKSRETKKGKEFFVNLSSFHASLILEKCESREMRKRYAEFSAQSGSVANLKRLQKAIALRYEIAQMLVYKNYTEYALETELIKNGSLLQNFLANVDKIVLPFVKSDWKETLQESKINGIKKPEAYDVAFLKSKIKAKKLSMDEALLSEYLEFDNVLNVTFDFFAKIFGVKVEKIQNFDKVLHKIDKDILLYKWTDVESEKLLGFSLLDLFPRDGKYGHACVSNLDMNKSGQNFNSKSLIMNCQRLVKDGKKLISYNYLNTFLHEMGHLLHSMCAENTYEAQSAFSTSNDFVEIPSQFLENLLEEDSVLNKYFVHFKTKKKLRKNIVSILKKRGNLFLGSMWYRQIGLALVDLELHGENSPQYFPLNSLEDMRKVYGEIFDKRNKIFAFTKTDIKQMGLAKFGHIMGVYESRYYSYTASFVFMCEIWNKFIEQGINKKSGMRFRKIFLAPGSSLDESDIIKNYLGENILKNPKFIGFKNKLKLSKF